MFFIIIGKELVNDKPDTIYYTFIQKSNFDFYSNGRLVDKTNCNEQLAMSSLVFRRNYLILSEDNKYSSEMCPYLFRNAQISRIDISVSSSLIKTNIIGFKAIESSSEINSNIDQLMIDSYHVGLNLKFINNKNINYSTSRVHKKSQTNKSKIITGIMA